MDVVGALERLFSALDAGMPIHELMRDNERAAGREVIIPGSVPWLSSEDWHPTVVVSKDGKRVRLIAIVALNPGRGALRRTITGIVSAGLEPRIVEPTIEMQSTLKRWGWRGRHCGSGLTAENIWYPRKQGRGRIHDDQPSIDR